MNHIHRDFVELDSKLILRVRNELNWRLVPASCRSGFAWVRTRESGAEEVLGCITKVDPRQYLEPTPVELKRAEILAKVSQLIRDDNWSFMILCDMIRDHFTEDIVNINNEGIDGQLEFLFGQCFTIEELRQLEERLERGGIYNG